MKIVLSLLFSLVHLVAAKTDDKALSRGAAHRELKKGIPIIVPGGNSGGSCPSVSSIVADFVAQGDITLFNEQPESYACGHEDGRKCFLTHSNKTYSKECTQCMFEYANLAQCFPASCDLYNCAAGTISEANNSTAVDAIVSAQQVSSITLCVDWESYGYWKMMKLTNGCSLNHWHRAVSKKYTQGSTNVNDITLFMKSVDRGAESKGFEGCDISIQGRKCSSCDLCSSLDLGSFAADCTNLYPEAVSTCNDFDSFATVETKILTLKEGATPPPYSIWGGSSGAQIVRNGSTGIIAAMLTLTMWHVFSLF